MSPPGTLASRIVGLLGHTRVLAAIAAAAVVAVLALTLLDDPGDAGGTARLQVQASARNASSNGERSAAKVDGAAGNRIEYALAAVNAGQATLTKVALQFTPPPSWGASLVRGSCRLRQPGADFKPCSDRLGEQDLSADRLRAGERLEARVSYTLDPPPCRTSSVSSQTASDSAQTALTNPAVAAVSYGGLSGRLPRCGTNLGQLLSAVPAPTRSTCTEWPGLGPPVLARVQCLPKSGAKYAVYLQYRTPAIAGQVYGLIADRDRPQACGAFRSGAGAAQDPDGKRVVTCSNGARGVAHLTWYDDGTSVFAYADGESTDPDPLLGWWRTDG